MENAIPTDLTDIAAALGEAFPGLPPVGALTKLGEGFNSLAVETADGIVFRIAKNSETSERHAKEAKLLPVLGAYVTVPIPQPKWHTRASAQLTFGAIGYPKIDGLPLAPSFPSSKQAQRIASGIARFLVALHGFPPDQAIELGVPGPDARHPLLLTMQQDVLPPLRDALSADEFRRVETWWDSFLNDARMWRYNPVLSHCDLWYENILVDREMTEVLGVLDFENVTVGDSAADFATLLHHRSGHDFLARVERAYLELGGTLDADHAYRVQRLWELRPFDGIQFSANFNDAQEMSDSIAKLRRGPILAP